MLIGDYFTTICGINVLNESKDVQIRLISAPVSNGYLQFFLLSPPDASGHQSEQPWGSCSSQKICSEGIKKKKKALVLFESLLDEN